MKYYSLVVAYFSWPEFFALILHKLIWGALNLIFFLANSQNLQKNSPSYGIKFFYHNFHFPVFNDHVINLQHTWTQKRVAFSGLQ